MSTKASSPATPAASLTQSLSRSQVRRILSSKDCFITHSSTRIGVMLAHLKFRSDQLSHCFW